MEGVSATWQPRAAEWGCCEGGEEKGGVHPKLSGRVRLGGVCLASDARCHFPTVGLDNSWAPARSNMCSHPL